LAIIGKNDTESEGIMQVIQAELVDNEELISDFGPFKPGQEENKPWALGRMSVAKRTRRAKEATITTFGSGAKTVLGYRTDWTICDDVITEKNSSTPEQRQKIKDWFNLCVSTGPEHYTSRLTVVGTRFDPADLYGDIFLQNYADITAPDKDGAGRHPDLLSCALDDLFGAGGRWWRRILLRFSRSSAPVASSSSEGNGPLPTEFVEPLAI